MNSCRASLSMKDELLLAKHGDFYRALDEGRHTPTTPAQWHFVAVCRQMANPITEHEHAYVHLKVLQADNHQSARNNPPKQPVPLQCDDGENDIIVSSDLDGGLVTRQAAVERIFQGCGDLIPTERGHLVPDVLYCVNCQRKRESVQVATKVTDHSCPRCARQGIHSPMIWRTARDPSRAGYFLGCSRYPQCRYTENS